MSIEENKEIAVSFFETGLSGDFDRWAGMMHDDFRYWGPGRMPLTGWTDKAGLLELANALMGTMAGPMTLRVGAIVAEGDRVVMEMDGDVALKDGGRYDNVYLMSLRLRDGKILEFVEFGDSLHLYQTFDVPGIRGPQKPRESLITEVTRVLTSPGA